MHEILSKVQGQTQNHHHDIDHQVVTVENFGTQIDEQKLQKTKGSSQKLCEASQMPVRLPPEK
jgi:hypothetical protein